MNLDEAAIQWLQAKWFQHHMFLLRFSEQLEICFFRQRPNFSEFREWTLDFEHPNILFLNEMRMSREYRVIFSEFCNP